MKSAVSINSALILDAGRQAITQEANALCALANVLDDSFVKAVEVLSEKNCRVVVSGMGKSGHIGRKIAATLASVGVPSFFVHPGEASHGDLGMITPNDKLLLLSHSGETHELKQILDYSRRFHIQTIAITSRANSNLASVSDVAIVYPDLPEACPMGLAPTTSTTIMLALGDALAIATLKTRSFTPTDFRTFHPGGNLGKQLARVRDFMHTKDDKLPLVLSGTLMSECLIKMNYYGFGCVAIVDKSENLLGIITDGDLRRHIHAELFADSVDNVMTKNPVTITGDILMAEALSIMQDKSITSLFICNNQKPIGLLHIHDCLKAGII
jgi:arabinose-5-phosphate isomerase